MASQTAGETKASIQIRTPAAGWRNHNPVKRQRTSVFRNGRERIRTSEGVRQQIYSLPPLATWVHARIVGGNTASSRLGKGYCSETRACVHDLESSSVWIREQSKITPTGPSVEFNSLPR